MPVSLRLRGRTTSSKPNPAPSFPSRSASPGRSCHREWRCYTSALSAPDRAVAASSACRLPTKPSFTIEPRAVRATTAVTRGFAVLPGRYRVVVALRERPVDAAGADGQPARAAVAGARSRCSWTSGSRRACGQHRDARGPRRTAERTPLPAERAGRASRTWSGASRIHRAQSGSRFFAAVRS